MQSKILMSIIFLALASCRKELNVLPTTQMVDGNVIVDQKSAQTALNGVYYCFANANFDGNSNPVLTWLLVNEITPSELSGLFYDPTSNNEYSNHIYSPSFYRVGSIWSYNYKVVNAANNFLKNIEPIDNINEVEKKKLIGEAKFLRAYANSMLLFYYGQYNDLNSPFGIILRNEPVNSSNIQLERSNVKDCYDYILGDIEEAISVLPELNTQNIYACKWAAKLLKARILMERGSTKDYEEVVTLCKDIISNSPYELEDDVKNIFLSKGLSSREVILGVQPFTNDNFKYLKYIVYNQPICSELLVELFENDPRKNWIYQIVPGYNGDINVFTKYYPGNANDPRAIAVSNVSYSMRLTEAYLLQAEAIVASGGNLNEAKNLLKTVKQHAGFTSFSDIDTTNTPEYLQLLIIKEEIKNFVGESGQDWFAECRLPFTTLQNLQPSIRYKSLLVLPIPQSEIQRNLKLAGMQNPGYGN